MAILGPLFDSNNGWYIVTTGADGKKKKVTFSSPLDYYVSMGVMPIIGPEYVDLEDVDSEVESDEGMAQELVQDENLVQNGYLFQGLQELPEMTDAEMDIFECKLDAIEKKLDEKEKEWAAQNKKQVSNILYSSSSYFMNTGPSTSSASVSSNSTKHLPSTSSSSISSNATKSLPSTSSGLVPSSFTNQLPSTSSGFVSSGFTNLLPSPSSGLR